MFRSVAAKLGMSKPRKNTFGQIISVDGDLVTGWLEGDGPFHRDKLTFSVDEITLDYDIGSVRRLEGDTFRCEFSICLRRPTAQGEIVRACYGDARGELAGSPWRVNAEPKTDFELAFLHVPKTAGTSLRLSLENALGPQAIFPSQEYLNRRGGGYPKASEYSPLSYGLHHSVRVLQGHLSLPTIHRFAPEAKVIAVFREPVSRVLSLIKHRLHADGDQYLDEGAIAAKFLDKPRGDIANGQIRMLLPTLVTGQDQSALLAQAADALTKIDILGVTERYESLIKNLTRVVGKPLQAERLNATKLPRREFSARFIQRVADLNELDTRFYEIVVAEVAKREKS